MGNKGRTSDNTSSNSEIDSYLMDNIGYTSDEIKNSTSYEELYKVGEAIWEGVARGSGDEIEIYNGPDGGEDGEEYTYVPLNESNLAQAVAAIANRERIWNDYLPKQEIINTIVAHYEIGESFYQVIDGEVRGTISANPESIKILQNIVDTYGVTPQEVISEIHGYIAENLY